MELLLLFALGAAAYVIYKQSRGEPVSVGALAGGCLGIGCLGIVLLSIAGIVVLWVLLEALADIDLSLGGWGEGESRQPSDGPGAS